MIRRSHSHPAARVAAGSVVLATILLLGVVLLAAGHFTHHRVPFYAGLMVTLAGVLVGVLRLVVGSEHTGRSTW
jgi:hypothetical protein